MAEKVKPKKQEIKKTVKIAVKKPRAKKAVASPVKKEKKLKVKVTEAVAEVPVVETVAAPEVEALKEEGMERKPGFLQAVGRRKESVARVKIIKNGAGKATVNGKDIKEYFGNELLVDAALGAMTSVSQLNKLDISAKVSGGGKQGQAEAMRLGTARALLQLNPIFKKNLRKAGFLTRDPRMKERKKFGLKKARRAPQWAKR